MYIYIYASPPRSPDTTSFARSKPRVNTGPSSRRNQNSSTPPRHIMAQTATSPTATHCNAMQDTGVLCNTPPRHVMAQTTVSATAFETATTCAFASASKAAVNDAVCTSRNSATVATSSALNTANGRQVPRKKNSVLFKTSVVVPLGFFGEKVRECRFIHTTERERERVILREGGREGGRVGVHV